MSMINSLKFSSWLKHCTETRFYVERCEEHAKKYKTIYCRSCMGTLASMRAGKIRRSIMATNCNFMEDLGRVRRLEPLLDASNIQVYRINFKKIVYLNPNVKGRVKKNDRNPKCESCRRKLIDFEYRFLLRCLQDEEHMVFLPCKEKES